jgi:hypothetical protein
MMTDWLLSVKVFRQRIPLPGSFQFTGLQGAGGHRGQAAGGGFQGPRHQPETGPPAALFAFEDPGVDEYFHVVGDGGLEQSDRVGEVADTGLPALGGRDHGQQPHSTRWLRAKLNAANRAFTPLRNRLSGCTWWTRSGRKNPEERDGRECDAQPQHPGSSSVATLSGLPYSASTPARSYPINCNSVGKML